MRGERATGKIQKSNYHHGSCGPSLTCKTSSVYLIFTHGTHRNVKNRWVRSRLKGYFSLNDFWHSDASRAWKSKTPTTFYLLKKARNSRDGNYSFEFCPLQLPTHRNRQVKSSLKGYFSLNDFWHSDASLAWRSKTPTSFYPLKKTRRATSHLTI